MFALSAYKGATKLTMRYSSAASTAGMCAWKFGTISGCTAAQMSGSNEKFYINTMTADSAYVEIVCSVDGKASITKRVTVVKQKKGDTGDPGEPGDDGKQGCMLRPRGTWTAQTQYVYNDQYRDVVLYNNSVYIVKATHTSAVSFESSKWEPFNEFINVATSVLLANKGYIDVLGAARLFVGDTNKSTGWEMTNGYIKHIKSGLTLTADGKLYDPDGLHLSVGGKTVQAIVDGAVDKIQIGGRNYLRNSAFEKNTDYWDADNISISVDSTSKRENVNTLKIVQNSASDTNLSSIRLYQNSSKLNPTSLSFWAKADRSVNIKVRVGSNPAHTKTFAINTNWQRCVYEDINPASDAVVFGALSACTWWLSEPMQNEGTKASDWSPAPEDVSVKIEENSSKIEQLPDQISLTVDQKIENVQIGNRNILKDSGSKVIPSGTSYFIRKYESTIQFETGKKYTVVIKGSTSIGQSFGLWVNGASINVGHFPSNMTGGVEYKHITMPSNIGTPSVSTLHLYNYPDPKGSSKPCEIEWIAMYEGHIKPPMDWSPATEDLTSMIEENSSKIEQLPDQISLTVKKEVTSGGLNYITNTQDSVEVTGANKNNQVVINNWKINKSISGKKCGAAFKIKFEGCVFTSSSSVCMQTRDVGGWYYSGLTATTIVSENKEYVIYRNTNTAQTVSKDGEIQIRIDYVSGGKITISEIRAYDVPEGGLSEPLPWYPSKWDTKVLSSEIKQTADSISLKVAGWQGGTNLLPRSKFSESVKGWNVNGSPAYGITTAKNEKCLYLSGTTSGSGIWQGGYMPIQYKVKGCLLSVSFDIYNPSNAKTLRIGLEGANSSEYSVSILNKGVSGWTRVAKVMTYENVNTDSFIIYTDYDNYPTVYIKNVKIEFGPYATNFTENEKDVLLSTGIDIINKKLVLTADNTLIQSNDGKQIAMFTVKNGRPLLSAENIDVDNLSVNKLSTKGDNPPVSLLVNGNDATINFSGLKSVGMTPRQFKMNMGGINDFDTQGILGGFLKIHGYKKTYYGSQDLYALLSNDEFVMINRADRWRCRLSGKGLIMDFLSSDGSVSKSYAFGGFGTQVFYGGQYYSGYTGTMDGMLVVDGIICRNTALSAPYYEIDESNYINN